MLHTLMALLLSFSCSMLLEQLTQLQLLQNSPLAKQSQYLQSQAVITILHQLSLDKKCNFPTRNKELSLSTSQRF